MAKKLIFVTKDECEKASSILKEKNIEHILVSYPKKERNGREEPEKAFIVVRNVIFKEVKNLNLHILRKKSVKRFETLAIKHNYFEPTFICKCRHCGKQFNHHIKEAAWCSSECRNEFSRIKREQRKLRNERKTEN